MVDFKGIIEESTQEVFIQIKNLDRILKFESFINLRGQLDCLYLKDTGVMSYGYTPYTQ